MLEVFAVISLCRVNRRNALARGRKPGGFIALTIILWVVFEFIGMIAGTIILGSDYSYLTVLLIALPCAGLGGLISFLIAKNCPQGNYVDPSTIAKPVIRISRTRISRIPISRSPFSPCSRYNRCSPYSRYLVQAPWPECATADTAVPQTTARANSANPADRISSKQKGRFHQSALSFSVYRLIRTFCRSRSQLPNLRCVQ